MSETSTEQETADGGTPTAIVGIGVGAASLPSLADLLASVREDAGAAFVIAVRERDTVDAAALMGAVAGTAALSASMASDDERLVPGRVYIGARDQLLTLEGDRLRVRRSNDAADRRGAIDSMLVSLAEHAQERAVAILLAGLGSEGAAGIVATKKFGGLSIAEETGVDLTAQGASDPAAVADMHLPVERIGGEITRYVDSLRPILREEERDETSGDLEAHVTQVITILRNVTGNDFHGYKRGTFIRRVQRRIQVVQIEGGLNAYVERLRTDRDEVQHLFQDLLIGVTQFFRDPAEFEVLERELPRLFASKGPPDQFRVWVLGCATGEEAYSIAILLREHMATLDHPPEVQIFATDLDARALSIARAGRYADTIAAHVRPDRLERWFVREGDTYCVSKELREMCIFSPHNIVKDAPFSRTDILSCRNLLIYLSTDLQNRVIPIFHFSLQPNGVLFLGSSENVTRHTKLFAPIDRKSRVFRRLDTANRIIPDFPLTPRPRNGEPMPTLPGVPFEGRLPASVSRQAEAVAERYAPAYVVVDAHGEVLHFSGRTGRYLEPSAGAASLNLTNLVHRDLRLDVRTALARAVGEARRVEVPRLTLRQDDRAFTVTVVVEPLTSGDTTVLSVLFQDGGPVFEGDGLNGDRLGSDEHVQRLEGELRVTRDRLQATIEELESTNEELKSSNEEYQSINEELQSANEEMETSKEELQSVNEELQTVNGELGHRVGELGRANSDMKNLLESTQIATVFLDNELRIRNFTPAATDVFHLLDTDVGRPLDHVVSRVSYPELPDDVRRVLKTLVPVERQVSGTEDRHFSARVLPYRSIDNYISGAVVTFTDLTAVHEAQAAMHESEARYRVLFESIDEGFCLCERVPGGPVDYRYLTANPAFERQSGLTDPVGATIRGLVPEVENEVLERYRRVEETGLAERFVSHVAALDRWFEIEATAGDLPGRIAVLFRDITDRQRIEQTLRLSEERQAFLLHLSDVLRSDANVVPAIEAASRLLGERLDASRVVFGEIDEANGIAHIRSGWAADGTAPHPATLQLEGFGGPLLDDLRAGRAVRYDDVGEPPYERPDLAALAAIGVQAGLSVPLLVDGAFSVNMSVQQDRPRHWTDAEVDLTREVAERLWAAVERARVEEALRDREANLRVLVAELQHRVRNILTVTRLTFARTFESDGSREEVAEHFKGRLDAMARTQVLLTQGAGRTADLEEMIRDELLSVGVGDGENVVIEGPEVLLPHTAAEALSMALHELTTNALKYGALRAPGATLEVRWHVNIGEYGKRVLDLCWVEQGVPAVSVKPSRQGFGRELIEEALPYRLGAKTSLVFEGGGVRCSISVPLPAEAEAASEGMQGGD